LKIFQVFSKLCASPYLNLSFLLTSTQSFVDLLLPPPLSSHDTRSSSPLLPGISLVRLVQFGEANSLIHRLRCYPISSANLSTPPQSGREKPSTTNTEARLWNLLRDHMMDGVQSVDDLVYEASAWAIKSQTSTPVRNSTKFLSASEPSPVLNPNLSDAVVEFTSKLLKEKEEDLAKGKNPRGSLLAEVTSSSVGSKTSSDQGLNENYCNAIHLLWH
uniref:Mediator of RNA polymerase II transcription subunit 12-like protein n=1 Tax=Rodentolepis nana TaxID=102285 RepID=A0A0R3TZL3_RODNA